jgi:ribosome-associated protein
LSSTTAVSFVPTPAAPPATTGRPLPPALTRACLAAKTAADNKGQDVVVLDLRPLTPLFDFFVMSTGASRRQVHTIVEETDAALRSVGDSRAGVEGYDTSKWVVQDYGDVLVHVFDGDTRSYYSLEELWADAPKIDWQEELADLADGDDAVGD